ncbi:MAG: carbohydrate ABC transporter permease [Lachnospiraceae bacterium]
MAKQATFKKCIIYTGLILLSFTILVPFLWMISSSLKTSQDVFSVPMKWFPKTPVWENFSEIWTKVPMLLFFKNSFKLAIIITLLQVCTSTLAAYPFAKMQFPGRDIIFLSYVATIAVPWQVYMIPQFLVVRQLHLADTHLALILMQAFSAFGVFLIRQAYLGIPKELSEAARIDGLGEFGIYRTIMLPLVKPAIATLVIFTFVTVWNDYMGPMIYLNSNELKTIQLGLRMFVTQYSADYNLVMAAALISLIPVGVLFLSLQRFFIEGVATSGLKG